MKRRQRAALARIVRELAEELREHVAFVPADRAPGLILGADLIDAKASEMEGAR